MLSFLYNVVSYGLAQVRKCLRQSKCCKCLNCSRWCQSEITLPYLFSLCETGNIIGIKQIVETNKNKIEPYLQECLEHSITYYQKNIVEFLLSINAKPTNAMMKHVCENNKCDLVLLLLKNGIKPEVVYRYAKSSNIINMTNRFETKSENIN